MLKLMTIIVQTTRTKGFANVTEQVFRNIATFCFIFKFQCVNCSWFGAINFVFEISPKKEVHGREVWGTRRVFNGTPSSTPCVWKSCIEVSLYIATVVGRCSILLKVTLVVITKQLWNLWTDKLLKQLKWVHFFETPYIYIFMLTCIFVTEKFLSSCRKSHLFIESKNQKSLC